jgi:glycosyltransferase 2 family protein
MYGDLYSLAKSFDEKVGWRRVGIALSLSIIAIAAMVLYYTLHDINPREVVEALEKKHDVGTAALFVAAGYVTLTLYDLFALRALGHARIPYRIAALAGFTSYAVGHNIGASAFTAGVVRYRIYSTHGLSAIEVAKLCFIAGLTFWLGNATVLGLGILIVPDAASAIDGFWPLLNRVLALATLGVLATYIAWVWRTPRVIGRHNWVVTLPDGPLTLLQIGIGIVDLGCCAAAMYMLVPAQPYIGFITLAVIFVSSTLLGFASHSPGGLGVFDGAMVGALFWHFNFDKNDLVAGLLLFRLLYYLVPFALSIAILGSREIWLSIDAARRRRAGAHSGDGPR